MAKFREIFRGKTRYVTVRPEQERPQTETESAKREVPDGLWTKCDQCRAMLYHKDLERNFWVCDKCGYHFPIGADTRLAQLLDDVSEFAELDADLVATNPLDFPEYPEKLAKGREKTGRNDAVITGVGKVGGVETVLAVMDFKFMGGSMGSVVGERVTRAFEYAASHGLPIVSVAASGGARMQEGILSLMQMEKTAAAVERVHRKGLLYISILTQPTTAGVFGSFASLGDINIAEPGATIGFAGQRVIEETIRKAIPPNLQKAETVFENGFIDRIIPRPELKGEIAKLLLWHTAKEPIGALGKPAALGEGAAEPAAGNGGAKGESQADDAAAGDGASSDAPKGDKASDEAGAALDRLSEGLMPLPATAPEEASANGRPAAHRRRTS